MAFRIKGHYVASCSCSLLCPCPVDGQPHDPKGNTECYGVGVFNIAEGSSDGVDLAGVKFAFYNYFPSNITAGKWRAGVIVDEAASDEQNGALGGILSGEAGGPFAEFAPLISENLGMERAKITISGDSATVAGKSDVKVDVIKGADGNPTTVKNAMFGFAPEFAVGTSSGNSSAFGLSFEPSYGESAEYEFSSEPGAVHARI